MSELSSPPITLAVLALSHCHIKKENNSKNVKITYVTSDCHALTLSHTKKKKMPKSHIRQTANVTLSHTKILEMQKLFNSYMNIYLMDI
jgi:phosphopantetheinyl transferase (holo-ACP synthase)